MKTTSGIVWKVLLENVTKDEPLGRFFDALPSGEWQITSGSSFVLARTLSMSSNVTGGVRVLAAKASFPDNWHLRRIYCNGAVAFDNVVPVMSSKREQFDACEVKLWLEGKLY